MSKKNDLPIISVPAQIQSILIIVHLTYSKCRIITSRRIVLVNDLVYYLRKRKGIEKSNVYEPPVSCYKINYYPFADQQLFLSSRNHFDNKRRVLRPDTICSSRAFFEINDETQFISTIAFSEQSVSTYPNTLD